MISSSELLERVRCGLRQARDLTHVRWIIEKMAQDASLRHAVYHLPGIPGSPAVGEVTLWSYPDDWVSRYLQENYRVIDPVVSIPKRGALPVDWSDLARDTRRVRTMFGEATEHGVGPHGLTIPLRGQFGEAALISFTADQDLSTWTEIKKQMLPGLHLAAYHVHERVLELAARPEARPLPPLSPREGDCLALILQGMQNKEIARTLGIRPWTVDEYIKALRLKLGARSKTHCVSIVGGLSVSIAGKLSVSITGQPNVGRPDLDHEGAGHGELAAETSRDCIFRTARDRTAGRRQGRPSMSAARTIAFVNEAGVGLAATDSGGFEISVKRLGWKFAGRAAGRVVGLTSGRGEDRAGAYHEIAFDGLSDGAARRCSIRLYEERSVALFEIVFVDPGDVREYFPVLSRYPRNLRHLAYASVFGGFSFKRLGADGPWVFFDAKGAAFILSPASNFMNSHLRIGPRDELCSGATSRVRKVPAGFVHTTALAIADGINRCFDAWGRFLTDLAGKKRPTNDADVGLKYLGYWTDRGAAYYYNVESGLDYPSTLLGVRDDFKKSGISLGYMQIDSWFYPKGHDGRWRSGDRLGGGAYLYEASKEVFPGGLRAFQKELGLPLVTHSRWIDAKSPYRKNYAISGNVSVDPALWRGWMDYLSASGVHIYEQDWLSGPAHPERDFTAGDLFMGLMAESAQAKGVTLQYCMPLPRHFLQGSKYSNLTTIRTSADRFGRNRWKAFLFNGRLATALGEWPWTDVFRSSETSNLLLATLSGGMVGVGDAIGEIDRSNLMRAIRADGVIIKPDDPLTPLDASYLAQAVDRDSPVISCARTEHGGGITSYVFAFGPAKSRGEASFSPNELGYAGPVYAYDYFAGRGTRVQPRDRVAFSVPGGGAYWIVVPIGPSGAAFLGDRDKFVGNGRNRVASVKDDGVLHVKLALADGETRIRLHGFSSTKPSIGTSGAGIEDVTYDIESGLFRVELAVDSIASPEITFRGSPS